MAECHPVAFRWPMKAKVNGAKLIHVDPRFTRTTAMCDIHAPIRTGSDIAFLGGLINYVINSDRWNTEPFFKQYVVNYTNAPTIIQPDFKDTEDLSGVFSGLMEYTGGVPQWPYNGFVGEYDNKSWQYYRGAGTQPKASGGAALAAAGTPSRVGGSGAASVDGQKGQGQPAQGSAAAPEAKSGQNKADTMHSGEQGGGAGAVGTAPRRSGPPYDDLVRSLKKPAAHTDPTLQDPRCVFQIIKRHFSRYTPEEVEAATGCPRDRFLQVANTVLENSGPDRTTAWVYAVGWTQHTNGPQVIGCCALLQLLLGNFGRPGAGIMALRGHASIQGSTDIPTLYHSIHGYMAHPSGLKKHDTLEDWMRAETTPTGYWSNTPKFMVSYLKSMYGAAATPDNDFGYDWHPKIIGDHSHMPMFMAAADGNVKGMLIIGQNPATSLNAHVERRGLRNLEWLVVKDNWMTETATHWYTAPEVRDGTVNVEDIKTEVFFFPSSQIAETAGSFTNTQRMLQWHYKAANPPGDCRSDLWFTHQLAKRLKGLYADSTLPRDQGFKQLIWDFDPDEPPEIPGEPSAERILKEINGYYTDTPSQHLPGFGALKDDGSTTCASWIYCGCYPAPDKNLTQNKTPDPPGQPGAQLGWGFAWPANRRVLYNRASADLQGNPWSERKRWVWWDANAANAPDPKTGEVTRGKWTGYDVPDFAPTKAPSAAAKPDGVGLDALSGTEPFIMKGDGRGWLYVPSGLVDGPIPTHYEPAESVVHNPLYKQQNSPVYKRWKREDNPLAEVGDPKYPYIISTYRLTEHYLAGAMSRWLPALTELQPELFIEVGPELAADKGIGNLDWVRISTPRGEIHAKALVTARLRRFVIAGKAVDHVGMPWHWGWQGLTRGDVVNTLTPMVGDPNVSIHEGKSFICNVEKV